MLAGQIPGGEDRSEAHYKLTYALANDGDFDRALEYFEASLATTTKGRLAASDAFLETYPDAWGGCVARARVRRALACQACYARPKKPASFNAAAKNHQPTNPRDNAG